MREYGPPADILRGPAKVLLSLNSPLSEILYESARSQTNLLAPTGTLTTTVESCPQQPNVPPVSHVNCPIPSSTLVSTGVQNAVSPLFDLEPHIDLDELDLTYLDWDQFMAPSTDIDDLLATASTAEYLAPSLSNPCEAYSTASTAWLITGNSVADAQGNSASQPTIVEITEPNLSSPDDNIGNWPLSTSSSPHGLTNALDHVANKTALPSSPAPSVSVKRPRRRGALRSEDEKQQTHKTRQLGACTRCRVQKVRVSSCCQILGRRCWIDNSPVPPRRGPSTALSYWYQPNKYEPSKYALP